MKNKICCLFFMFFAIVAYAQNSKTKIVYETVVVYDTITIYDTLFVYDTIKTENLDRNPINFKNNFVAENALLAIDTNNFSATVLLLNKKDTATLSINSIILSETNKNLDTMKKQLLTLAATALLTPATIGQTTDSIKNIETIANSSSASPYSIETVVFKKNNSSKTYDVTLPTATGIRLTRDTRKAYRKQLSKNSLFSYYYNFSGSIITNIDSSNITIKYGYLDSSAVNAKELRKIRKDKTLSVQQKENKYYELVYPETMSIPMTDIKSIHFSRFNSKNKRFYNSFFKKGFNESRKHFHARACINQIYTIGPFFLIAAGPGAILSPLYFPVIGSLLAVDILAQLSLFKKINVEKWQIQSVKVLD